MQHQHGISAYDQIQTYANEKGWNSGWDDQKKRFFVIQARAFNTDSPSSDPNFLLKREIQAKAAILDAKVEVIEFINQEMSAKEKLATPGTDVHRALHKSFDEINAQILNQKSEIERLLASVGEREEAFLDGVTAMDRLPSLMDSAIKKLDESYDVGKIGEEERARFDQAKSSYEESYATLSQLEAELEEMNSRINEESTSEIETLAAMPLFGSTVIAQAESYDAGSKEYEVATLFVWSAALEQAARETLLGTAIASASSARKKSLRDWLGEQDLSVIIGPRQYLDANGRRHFLGITARPQGSNSAVSRSNRRIADKFAQQMAVFSLYADVAAHTKATQSSLTTSSGGENGISDMQGAESLAEELTQEFEKMTIRGLGKVLSERVTHPISGQKMYVSVYGIAPDAAQAALESEVQNFATAVEVNKKMQFERGRSAAMEAEVASSRIDAAAYRAGAANGRSSVVSELRSRTPNVAVKRDAAGSGTDSPEKESKQSKEGSFMSGGDVEDDF